MKFKAIKILALSAILVTLSACCKKLKFALAPIPLEERLVLDSSSNFTGFHRPDSINIIGKYNFVNLPGYTGNIIELKSDFTFTNRKYSDYRGIMKPRLNKGKWKSTSDSTLQLKDGCSKLNLVHRHYNNLIFLVPIDKLMLFEKAFNKNIENIKEVSNVEFEDQKHLIYDKLNDFSKICFISWNDRPKSFTRRESVHLRIRNKPEESDIYHKSLKTIYFTSIKELSYQLENIDSTTYDDITIRSHRIDSVMPLIARFRNTQVLEVFTKEDISIDSTWLLMKNLSSIWLKCNTISNVDSRIFLLPKLDYFGVIAENNRCLRKLKRQYKKYAKTHSLEYISKLSYLVYNKFSLRKVPQ